MADWLGISGLDLICHNPILSYYWGFKLMGSYHSQLAESQDF